MEYIALDSHKRYSFASVEEHTGAILKEARIDHRRGAIAEFLSAWKPGTSVAVETIGNWYWIVDEIEAAGMVPQLVHARRAKMMLASVNKTDKLDCHGLNRLQRTGTLPTVWIPPATIRDLRDLPRTRMVLSQERTKLKNRIHATLAKYAIYIEEASDAFGKRGLEELERKLELLPPHSRFCVERLLGILEKLQDEITHFEARMKKEFRTSRPMELLQTLPGVGFILSVVILLETGEVSRFPERTALGCLLGNDAEGTRFGRQSPLRPDQVGRESVSEVGLRRSGKLCRSQLPPLPVSTCQPALREDTAAQRPSEGSGSGGSSSCRGHLLDIEERRALQGTSKDVGFVHERVSANFY